MNAARILYRTRQFWQILRIAPSKDELDRARSRLTPAQLALFLRMQPGEQSHSLRVYSKLVEAGESDPDLLAAALLHDSGKIRYPLSLGERAWIVIGKALFPNQARGWSQEEIQGPKRAVFWKRPFIVAERHPDWGADLVSKAGASNRTIALIRRHQEILSRDLQMDSLAEGHKLPTDQEQTQYSEEWLLHKLQAADDES
jgi:hypothetical protein